MSRRTFVVIALLYFDVLTSTYAATVLADGTIIEIETIEPRRKPTQFDINRQRNIFPGRGPGGRVPGGRVPVGPVPVRLPGANAKYQTVVNGEPVIIEVIRDDQINGYGQRGQNQNYWQQMQKQNYNPMIPNQDGFIVTKEKSPYPNIEIYDVYTNGGTNNMRYPNQFMNGNLYPYHIGNQNRNENNFYTYPNQNKPSGMNGEVSQENIDLSNNKNQQDNNSGYLNNKDDKKTEQSNGDAKNNSTTGYIDKFPVILLNENEIRR